MSCNDRNPAVYAALALIPPRRLLTIVIYGVTMVVGTLAVLYYGMRTDVEADALTLAFTAFMEFQFVNVFNAHVKNGTSLKRLFFSNRMLGLSLMGVVVLQVIAVDGSLRKLSFSTADLSATDWLTAIAVASSILLLEEGRKLIERLRARNALA